ncbi:MAG: YdhR family protein [Caldilineaceae bacterium]
MHIQIVNFNLKGVSEADYRTLCDQLAPAFAVMPGLLAKVWLADAATNTYGGVYTWVNKAAMQAYMQSEIFNNVVNHSNLANITSKDFCILEGPTEVTHGLAMAMA